MSQNFNASRHGFFVLFAFCMFSIFQGGEVQANSVANHQVSAGGFHACAIDNTSVVCWGNNDYYQSELSM